MEMSETLVEQISADRADAALRFGESMLFAASEMRQQSDSYRVKVGAAFLMRDVTSGEHAIIATRNMKPTAAREVRKWCAEPRAYETARRWALMGGTAFAIDGIAIVGPDDLDTIASITDVPVPTLHMCGSCLGKTNLMHDEGLLGDIYGVPVMTAAESASESGIFRRMQVYTIAEQLMLHGHNLANESSSPPDHCFYYPVETFPYAADSLPDLVSDGLASKNSAELMRQALGLVMGQNVARTSSFAH